MRVKKITEVIGSKAFTDGGDDFGTIEEANLQGNKVDSWRIKVGGLMTSLMGGAKGVIIPHQFVKAMSDIAIINKATLPSPDDGMEDISEVA